MRLLGKPVNAPFSLHSILTRGLLCLAALILLALAYFSHHQYNFLRETSFGQIEGRITQEVIAEAHELQLFISNVEREARHLSNLISTGELDRDDYKKALSDLVGSNKLYFGGAIAFSPYAFSPETRLYAPYYSKRDGKLNFMELEDGYDYTLPEHKWFSEAIDSGDRWSAPYFDEGAGEALMTTYSSVFYARIDGTRKPIGVVTIDVAIDDIGHIVDNLNYGSKGTVRLTDGDGMYIFGSEKSRVIEKSSILSPDRWANKESADTVRQLLASPAAGVAVVLESGSDTPTWVSMATVKSTGWKMIDIFEQQELAPHSIAMRHQAMITVSLLVAAICLGLLAVNFINSRSGIIGWPTSFLITFALAAGTGAIWDISKQYESARRHIPMEINSKRQELAVEARVLKEAADRSAIPPVLIPTGVYLESIKFTSPMDIMLIGTVWQKFDTEKHRDVARGVIFPGAETVRMSAPSVSQSGNTEVVRWKFQGSLRISLDYRRFPLILDSVSLPMMPKDTMGHVMLIPDLDSYPYLSASSLPGIASEVFIAGWRLKRSFFELRDWKQRTTFGLNDSFDVDNYPEFYLTIEIEKVFIHAFISFLTPLIIAFIMVFILVLLSTRDKERLEFMRTGIGFDIGVSASIFFVVVLSHISLRQRIITEDIFYLEYFYFLMYANMLWVCFHSIFNGTHPDVVRKMTLGLTAKKAYFPVSFAIIFAFTLTTFYS